MYFGSLDLKQEQHTQRSAKLCSFYPGLPYRTDQNIIINHEVVPFSATAKLLGVTFDTSLTFNTHLTLTANKCEKRLNLMRMLTGSDWGGDTHSLLLLYKSIVPPILEYASIIFENAAPTNLKKTRRYSKQRIAHRHRCI